ncbi:hypothetical protein JCM5350_004248 [Sporobolomyces pararoseus]
MKFSAVFALALASVASAAPLSNNRLNTTNPDSGLQKRGYSGQATWYTHPGACGNYGSDSDYIVALQSSMYAGGSHCGKQIKITNTDTGATTTAKVADECPTCESSQSIDLSTAAFKSLGSMDQGVLPVSWTWA